MLETVERGAGGEIQLTDAMAILMREPSPSIALEYEGSTYDCGDKIGWLRANVALALKRPDLGEAARQASGAAGSAAKVIRQCAGGRRGKVR